MNFLGFNSPVIFIISTIILIILGPKRIEKGWLLFQRLLKFLLSDADNIFKDKSNVKSPKDLNSEKSEVSEVKEEVKEAKVQKSKESEIKEEVKDVKVKRSEVSGVKKGVKEAKVQNLKESQVKKNIKKAKVDESEIDTEKNNLKQNTIPDGSFSFIMVEQSEKLIRTTYEKYDESLNNSDKERISNK